MDSAGVIDIDGGQVAPPVRYSRETRWLHWATALLIVAQFALGEVWIRLPRADRAPLVSAHLSLGVLLGAVFVARVAWRVTGGRAIRFASAGAVADRVTHAVHGLLYVMIGVELALGYLARWSGGRPVVAFGVPINSPFGPFDHATHHLLGQAHSWLAWGIIVLATGHGLAAFYHARVLRDGVFRRMWA
ncbi:cytochrome b [Gluconacetobacter azotocaptans]|uniref:Cytochrome b n=1 Tax=Gluconacetobacter azotocaptans TaxID=142834 RepID=A0A7W4JT89_9PROT|nr:cytochrome b [Gluconacetobacter azotocaptans]MBB2190463.1 cytochrome b [Gluconacetobacter azotocaptans]